MITKQEIETKRDRSPENAVSGKLAVLPRFRSLAGALPQAFAFPLEEASRGTPVIGFRARGFAGAKILPIEGRAGVSLKYVRL